MPPLHRSRPLRSTALAVLLLAVAAGCTTADGGGGQRGPRFEEAGLIGGCPDTNLPAGSPVLLELFDLDGSTLDVPLPDPQVVEVSAPGTVAAGPASGSIVVSSPREGEVRVVVTLPAPDDENLTFVDRCVLRFDPVETAPECSSDEDCTEGFVCDAATASCVETPDPSGCFEDDDCGAAERCQVETGECVAIECLGDIDCALDEFCDAVGACQPIPVVSCALDQCEETPLGPFGEIGGRVACGVVEGTPPGSLDIELLCVTSGARLPVLVGCDLFGGPSCEGAFSARVDTVGGWSCSTVGISSSGGPVILESEDTCVLSAE